MRYQRGRQMYQGLRHVGKRGDTGRYYHLLRLNAPSISQVKVKSLSLLIQVFHVGLINIRYSALLKPAPVIKKDSQGNRLLFRHAGTFAEVIEAIFPIGVGYIQSAP